MTVEGHGVFAQIETMFLGHIQLDLFDGGFQELFDQTTVQTDDVVMVFPGRHMLVILYGLTKMVFGQLTRFNHQGDDPVDGGPGDFALPILQGICQAIDGEMVGGVEYFFGDQEPLAGDFQTTLFQKLGKIGQFLVDIHFIFFLITF